MLKADSGISYKPGKVGPSLCDFDGDGHLDLFVPQADGKCKLFRNDGTGKFTDVTATSGDLAKPIPGAVSAAWGDFDNDGKPDLLVCCLRGTQPLLPEQRRRHVHRQVERHRPDAEGVQLAGRGVRRPQRRRATRPGPRQRGPGVERAVRRDNARRTARRRWWSALNGTAGAERRQGGREGRERQGGRDVLRDRRRRPRRAVRPRAAIRPRAGGVQGRVHRLATARRSTKDVTVADHADECEDAVRLHRRDTQRTQRDRIEFKRRVDMSVRSRLVFSLRALCPLR